MSQYSTNWIDHFANNLINLGVAGGGSFIACSDREIRTVESLVTGKLPACYVEFLARMGRWAGMLFNGMHAFYPEILKFNEWAREALASERSKHSLPPEALVFLYDPVDPFYYFLCDGEDDPVVYTWHSKEDEFVGEDLHLTEMFEAYAKFAASTAVGSVPVDGDCAAEFPDNVVQLLNRKADAPHSEVIGCSVDEIMMIEARLGKTLPDMYVRYLAAMGRAPGVMFLGEFATRFPGVIGAPMYAQEMFEHEPTGFQLPDDAIIVMMSQGLYFYFIRATEGDDPPVYHYRTGSGQFRMSHHHYSRFIFDCATEC